MDKSKYKILCVLFFSVVLTTSFFAYSFQDEDKRLSKFNNLPTIEKIDSLNNYATNLKGSNTDLRIELGRKCYTLSQQENYELGLIKAQFNIGAGFFHSLQRDSALTYYRKSFELSKKSKNTLWVMNLSINLGQTFSEKYKFDSAMVYYNLGIDNAEILKDSVSLGYLINSVGFVYWKKGDFNSALEKHKKSLKILERVGDDKQVAASLNNIATSYFQLGNYKLALEYFIKSSELRKKYSPTTSPIILTSIGLIYLELDDTTLSHNYFSEALINAETTNSILGKAYANLGLGDLCLKQNKYNLAIKHYNKSKEFYTELNDQNGIAKLLNNIGLVYLKENEIKIAEKYFLSAYKTSKQKELAQSEVESFANYTNIQIINGQYILAKNNLEKIYKQAQKGNFVTSRLKILNLQRLLYEKAKDFKSALYFNKLYNNLKDSLFNEKSLRIISEIKEKHEADKKEKENVALQYENKIQKLDLNNQEKEKQYITIIVVFLFFVIAYLIYQNSLRKKRNASLLAAKNEVEKINEKLNKTNKLLKNLISTKDKFFSIIAHDLKNPFGTLLGATQILKMDDELSEEDKKELIEIIANDSERLYSLLENLLFWASSQTGKLKAKQTNIQISSLILDVVSLLESNAKNKDISFNIDVPQNLIISFDEFMFSTIIRNLLTNAIKFSYHGGTISIEAEEIGNKIHLKVIDQGVGISKENQTKLFSENSGFKQKGTDKEKGTGLGLILCRDFMKENDSIITLSSEVGKGTTFELILPKAK